MESTIIYFEKGTFFFPVKVLEMHSTNVVFILRTQDPYITGNLPLLTGNRCKYNPK